MSKLPVNENGRVSLHLFEAWHDPRVPRKCVLDLDCYPDEVPSIVWCEVMDAFGGVYDEYTTDLQRHIDNTREYGEYGFQFKEVYKNEEEYNYYWEDDKGRLVLSDELPQIYYCYYKDTALAAKC